MEMLDGPLRFARRMTGAAVVQARGWTERVQQLPGWTAIMEGSGFVDDHDAANRGGATAAATTARSRHLDFPSFSQFFLSKYAVTLILLTLVINRIHATVPPRIPYRSSAKVRSLVRGPAIFLLSRACYRIIGMILRMSASSSISTSTHPYYYSIGEALKLSGETRHADVLWSCFLAASFACVSESFVRALDHDLASITPINLFTLALLMHFHSTPSDDPIVPPSRAVYLLLLLSIGEVLALQLSAIRPWRIRLAITGTFAIVSRGAMIYFWLYSRDDTASSLTPAIQSLGRILPEAFFVGCSVLTVALRALVQLLTEGRLSKEVFGHASSLPHRDDDFILAIIKYGAATLEATAMKGLNNEVSTLSHPAGTYVELHRSSNSAASARSAGTGQVYIANPTFPTMPQLHTSPTPFGNEVRNVNAVTSLPTDVDPMSRSPSLRKEVMRFCRALWLLWKVYAVGILAEKAGLRRWARGDRRLARILRWIGIQPPSRERRRGGIAEQLQKMIALNGGLSAGRRATEDDDDAEDLDYMPNASDEEDGSESSSSSSGAGEESDGEDADPSTNPLALQRWESPAQRDVTPGPVEELTLLLQQEEQQDLVPVLIAHLQAGSLSPSPLTRRRYRALVPQINASDSSESALSSTIAARRSQGNSPTPQLTTGREEWNDDNFRTSNTCVVCCAEQRTIVLWPCRCLALCDDCRSELASRSSLVGGANLCPCCRSEVQGYSRIHIP